MNLESTPDGFAGVVSVSRGTEIEFEQAYGLADRAHGIASDRRHTVRDRERAPRGSPRWPCVSLIDDGALGLDTTARSVLGADLPLIADDVTVEHLLAHRSGIGDYVDEDLPEELPLKVPVQNLVSTEDYLPALDGFATKFPAGARFSYCNSGFVVLALIAERVSGQPFHDLVAERVFAAGRACPTPGSCVRTSCPARAAIGYLDDGRTNVFHLPVRGQRRRRRVHDRRRHPGVLDGVVRRADRRARVDGPHGRRAQRDTRPAAALRPRFLALRHRFGGRTSRAATTACPSAAVHDPDTRADRDRHREHDRRRVAGARGSCVTLTRSAATC